MGTRSKTCVCLHILFLLFPSFNTHLSIAAETISPGQSLSGNQTMVSKEANFELGFFTPGNSHNFYIGIWYKNIFAQTVIWVANREKPVSNTSTSELKISEDGNLVLLDQSKSQIWSSNSTASTPNSVVAVLLDTGNLVLRDQLNSSHIIWQSFDHPTDTLMPGGWFGVNKITGKYQSLTSWKNSEDPSQGPFEDTMGPDGSNQFIFRWNGSETYWQSGVWNGQFFSSIPEMSLNSIYKFLHVEDDKQNIFVFSVISDSIITRFVVDLSGQLKQWTWLKDSEDWILHWSQPDQCEVYSLCGSFGICDRTSTPLCSCPHGFQPASLRDWNLNDRSNGCTRKTHLQCGNKSFINGDKDVFLIMPSMGLPRNPQQFAVESAEECELACLNNCFCSAYAFGSGCSIWNGELENLRQLSDGDRGSTVLYLRLAASELSSSSSKNKLVTEIILITVSVAIITILCIVLGLSWRCQGGRLAKGVEADDGSLVRFRYADIQRATKNFSKKLGRGSFGPVFIGALPNSIPIAVKRLECLRHGEKQFRAEVSMLGTIQHFNLVRLRGFCSEGVKRLLVYDYMPNGSLDSHLFRNNSKTLDWRTRYQIILGVARGLAYLHEECRECIIHCDIKPENILLDKDFNPKVADFGMAKLLGRDFSRVLTTFRGTIGYLAPEWLSGLPITTKVDVYGFGMVVLEIISGRRNMENSSNSFFPVWAARKVNEGNVLTLLDEKLEGDADMEELSRASRIAGWCIQDCEIDRPFMGHVVHILEGVLEVNMPPIPRILQHLIQDQDSTIHCSNPHQFSIAAVSN